MAPLSGVALATLLSLLLAGEAASVRERRSSDAVQPPAGDFSLEYGEACSGLAPEECCAQQLELMGFRAQGEHLPRLVKNLLRLACEDARKVMAPQSCRSLAVMRGFRTREVDAICGPARAECGGSKLCNQCTGELQKLGYRGGHHVCRPLTYVKPERPSWR